MTQNEAPCTFEIFEIPPEKYRLPTDGKKWKRLCQQRRELALQLAAYVDQGIFVNLTQLESALGIPAKTIKHLLEDLSKLGTPLPDGRGFSNGESNFACSDLVR
jgi:hypothetical protein